MDEREDVMSSRLWKALIAAPICLPLAMTGAQAEDQLPLSGIQAYRQAHEPAILAEFAKLLAVPNVASNGADMKRNAELLSDMLRKRGLEPHLLGSPDAPDAPPLVYAEWKVPGAKRTLVLYAHYDGQPVNPAEWVTPPFEPTLRTGPLTANGAIIPLDSPGATNAENRLFARGAGDDKAGVMVILSAVDALKALGRHPTDNLKIVFEGEEEAGSPHMERLLKANRPLLASDLWVICDGPTHTSGRNIVIYGVRGDINIDLTVYGPNHPLHSGHYGNWAPNPALRLAQLLASMKDKSGRVAIEGWYDGIEPLGAKERAAVAATAAFDEATRRKLGFAAPETNQSLDEAVTEPSLNINGMASANVGDKAANVIPDTAQAVLDVRLVVGEEPRRQFDKLVAHVRKQGYLVLDRAPTDEERLAHPLIATMTLRSGAYDAARAPMSDPLAQSIAGQVRAASAEPIVELPTTGGSLPLSIIATTLGTKAIVVSTANNDDNQHTANENLRLGNLWSGIDLYAALLLHPEP